MGPLDRFLAELTRLGGAVSAAEALVADGERTLWRGAAGYQVGGEPLLAASGARFDAASLTKPWIATLALRLGATGELPLATRLEELVERVAPALSGKRLEDLLRHRSGLRAWTPLAVRLGRRLADRSALIELLATECALPAEEADRPAYSDLGYLLYGLLAEARLGAGLADLLDSRVCAALGVKPLGRLAADPPRAVECRLDNGREVELAAEQGYVLSRAAPFLRGRPQDGNARVLGFLAGHAGLFATADELLTLAREWLRPARLLSHSEVRRSLAGKGSHALGWARCDPAGSAGPALSKTAFGHTGFTGGSLWIDAANDRILILLSHRLSSRLDFQPVRREFHRLALETFPPR
jgi:CubicO group peptidase (beta-lactamase class C family)